MASDHAPGAANRRRIAERDQGVIAKHGRRQHQRQGDQRHGVEPNINRAGAARRAAISATVVATPPGRCLSMTISDQWIVAGSVDGKPRCHSHGRRLVGNRWPAPTEEQSRFGSGQNLSGAELSWSQRMSGQSVYNGSCHMSLSRNSRKSSGTLRSWPASRRRRMTIQG